MKTSIERDRLLDDSDSDMESPRFKMEGQSPWYCHRHSIVLLVTLSMSMCVHIIQLLPAFRPIGLDGKERTAFAHLEWNIESEFTYNSIYNSGDETATNDAWEAINYDRGTIALDNVYADGMGLPEAQPFPWDSSKGLFFLNGYHSLHCVKSIRRAVVQLLHGEPTSHDISHIMHCFEALLEDVMCYADDTPRYTSQQHPGRPGFGQKRQCRDWNQLMAFSDEHYSCWRNLDPLNKTFDTLLRYRFCPEGSPYNEYIQAIFGDAKD